jgi:hypothetical protein
MNRRQALAGISAMTASLALTSSRSFAMMDIEIISQGRAKELGLEVRANAAGPDAVRAELGFETKTLPRYSRVDLEVRDGGKLLLSSTLREEPAEPGRVIVSFAADRARLGQFTLRVVTGVGTRNMIGYDIPVKEFVDLDRLR